MSSYPNQLRSAIEAIEIRSTSSILWLGAPIRPLPSRVRRSLSPQGLESWLFDEVRDHLYEFFYCKGRPVPIGKAASSHPLDASTVDFVSALSTANAGQGSWQSGWRIKRAGPPVEVERDGLTLRARPGEYRLAGPAGHEDDPVELRLRPEHFQASPGFYLARSNEPFADGDTSHLVRLYWHSTPLGAIQLIRSLTTDLNARGLPFLLKAVSCPSQYQRRDSLVLYVRARDFQDVARACADIHARVLPHLRSGVPSLTKTLAPGLGFAEDPGEGTSFGLSRCGILARALILSLRGGIRSTDGRMEVLERELETRGIGIETPYLNPGSRDGYAFAPGPSRRTDPGAGFTRPERIAAVAAVARQLCAEAIWSDDRCNWVGPALEHDGGGSSEGSRWTALGPDLYGGTSGIALFLAESYAHTQDRRARDVALGAARHAAWRAETLSPRTPGFYTGWSGVALSVARVGLMLGEESLVEGSKRILNRFRMRPIRGAAFDLMSGLAGAIPPILTLSDLVGDEPARRLALRMGDRLVGDSVPSGRGRFWRSPVGERRGRIGLSHGASGAAFSLLELYEATGDARYRETAIAAFRFERRWFDREHLDWRDTRQTRGTRSGTEPTFASTWCHGAPGIALSRIRAAEITGDALVREEGHAALEATRRAVEADLEQAASSSSLCHGLAGNADVLLSGAAGYRNIAVRGADRVLRALTDPSPGWSGTGPKPQGLMLGMAGAGYLGLRVIRPETPTLLLPGLRSTVTCRPAGNSRPATRPSGGSSRTQPLSSRRK